MRPSTVLLVDKVLLSARQGHLRGVELFNLNLARDLVRLGHRVTVALDSSWARIARDHCGAELEVLSPLPFGGKNLAPLALLPRLGSRRWDALLLGNVANRLVPALGTLQGRRRCGRTVLIAHREASRRFVRALRRERTVVQAVNDVIAAPFQGQGFERVFVSYGITDAERFHPRSPDAEPPSPHTVDFCLLGQLDNAWKGADTAIDAYRALPDPVRERCHLHLASFEDPPALDDPGIVVHRWMPFESVPSFLRAMDVMLVLSRDEHIMRETFSQAAVQGMLSGLPLITTDLPVLAEKIDAGGGVVAPTVSDLTRALVELAGDPERRARLGAEARAIALERYVWDSERFAAETLFPED